MVSQLSRSSFGKNMVPFLEAIFEPLTAYYHDPLGGNAGSMDVKEEQDGYLVTVDVPGFDKSEVDVSMHDGKLTVTAKKDEKTDEKNERYHIRERRSQSFSRSLNFPGVNDDDVNAVIKNGVLTIHLKKNDPERKRKKVEVKSE